ncbi:MAG: hypothetical protein MN733_37205 [Nitrososphaera sp.]|nr:hypothetical protein [Nitrososphaera sp.]
MEIKVFSDAIDALEKLADAAISVKEIPKRQRRRYQDAVAESYSHLNAAANMVFLRLGDLLNMKKAEFLDDLQRLDNDKEWLALERDVRLCSNLRTTHPEMDGFLSRMIQFSRRDWAKARELVDKLLEREGTLADYISSSLKRLAKMAPKAREAPDEYKTAREAVSQVREAVRKERVRLIKSEVAFLDALSGRRGSA